MVRRFVTALLAAALALSGAGRAPASTRDADSAAAVTAEEEREARELLAEFNRKFVEAGDIDPLVKDYFVPDFTSRLPRKGETYPFLLVDWKDEAAPPDPEDLRRFYVATTNFLHAFFPLYAAAKKCAEEEDEEDGEEGGAGGEGACDGNHDPKLEKTLPPAAVEIMKTDPLLREMWLGPNGPGAASGGRAASVTPQAAGEAGGECVEGCASPGERKERLVENAEELRHLTNRFEDLGKVLREHLAAHPVSFAREAADEGEGEDEESREAEFRRFDPKRVSVSRRARVLGKEFYGYPAGTRLVCADFGALHAELVRVDGRLRILTVYVPIGD